MNNVVLKEEWRDIEGYEGVYMISNMGRVKSLLGWNGKRYIARERMLNPYKQGTGNNYQRSVVKLFRDGKKKDHKVHRLVAKTFIPNKSNKETVNHLDGNPLNNRVDNLEWCTQKGNIHHAIETGLTITRINTIDRDTMLVFLNNSYTYDEIAEELDIAKGTVYNYIKKFNIQKKYI